MARMQIRKAMNIDLSAFPSFLQVRPSKDARGFNEESPGCRATTKGPHHRVPRALEKGIFRLHSASNYTHHAHAAPKRLRVMAANPEGDARGESFR